MSQHHLFADFIAETQLANVTITPYGGEPRVLPNVFILRYKTQASDVWQTHDLVYIPAEMQGLFREGLVGGFELQVLELNSFASNAFTDGPESVLLSVVSKTSQERIVCALPELKSLTRRLLLIGVLASLVGAALTIAGGTLLFWGGLTLGLATHFIVLVLRLPRSTGEYSDEWLRLIRHEVAHGRPPVVRFGGLPWYWSRFKRWYQGT